MKIKNGSFYNKKVIIVVAAIAIGVMFFYLGKGNGNNKKEVIPTNHINAGEEGVGKELGGTTPIITDPSLNTTISKPSVASSMGGSDNVTSGFNGEPSDPDDGSYGALSSSAQIQMDTADTQAQAAETAPVTFQIVTKAKPKSETKKSDTSNPNVSFLNETNENAVYLNHTIIKPASPYQVMAGTVLRGTLQTSINSDVPSKVILARITQDVYDSVKGRYLLIPQGSQILGTYNSNVVFGQSRLLVVWQRIIMPNGTSIQLDNMQGIDLTGQAGFVGKVDNHFRQLMGGVVLSSALGAGTAVVGNNASSSSNPMTGNSNPTPAQSAGQGGGQAIINAGNGYTSKILNMAPTITIPIGYTFNIMVNADMILKPYGT